jgi:hypothetical protein
MECGEVATVPARVDETPARLHIFADEDHVHLQNGKSAILPLITICSGKQAVCHGRNELTDKIHLNGYGLSAEERWEYAAAVCFEKFDMDKVDEVYLYGDGASWIESADNAFSGIVHILDEYHYQKRMLSLLAGEHCAPFGKRLREAVCKDEPDTFERLLAEMTEVVRLAMPDHAARSRRIRAIEEDGGYLRRHWRAVQNRKRESSIGSCTEGLVSHVFSERFSMNPMGWSVGGLSHMSTIRVFVKNGGRVKSSDIGKEALVGGRAKVHSRIDKYERLIEAQAQAVISSAADWRWFDRESMNQNAPSGTQEIIKMLGRLRSIA